MPDWDRTFLRENTINDETGKPTEKRDKRSDNDFLDITALVRSLQRTEGNPDCFRRKGNQCDREDCSWRKYCLEDN